MDVVDYFGCSLSPDSWLLPLDLLLPCIVPCVFTSWGFSVCRAPLPLCSVLIFHLDSRLKLPLLHFIFFQLFLLFICIFWKFSSIDSQSPFLLFFVDNFFLKQSFPRERKCHFELDFGPSWISCLTVYFYRDISFHLSLKMCSYIPRSMLYLCYTH